MRNNKVLTTIFLLVMGLICCGVGGRMTFSQGKGLEKTTGVIKQIDEIDIGLDEDGNTEYQYDVYVTYTVDGTEYTSMTDYYEPSFEEGMEIEISYDPANPEVITGDSKGFGIYILVAGAVLTAAAIVSYLRI